ncbi:L-threonylcarbamoyladenylate synthase [Heyndrickxia acidicola]|uniref:Threonylcarbamoyl-AMP synthase n=1 Tax=Heyndrickxia acidicola TaxID=209389 RepID=A0ABU6MFV0_9BACI|nr:L-threonylcarbamoyladenylate synthase [Heyndrickxia acidicola]MED1202911.1 L-threonylcarbamoyladenylate synthase [Heyndrickxia acidicola]
MKTILWSVDKYVDTIESASLLEEAAKALKSDEVVAFPTETVYGLGANAKSDTAVEKIYKAKGRPNDNPLIVHISDYSELDELVESIPAKAKKLMDAFWPGPLTVILERKPGVLSEYVTAGLSTVGIRMPDHPVALRLIKKSGLPIAAPSANQSGRPSPTSAKHVMDDLSGRIAGVLDGGETGVGVESTVIDCSLEPPMIFRPGGISKEQIEVVIGYVDIDPALHENEKEKPKSPGMKYTHYAPDAPMYLVEGDQAFLQQLIEEKRETGLKVGVLATEESATGYDADAVIPCGSRGDLESVAHSLYDTLRAFNEENIDVIFSEVFPYQGIGLAIMNRLEKAAGKQWIYQGS